ncbi:MAG: chemotaxis protein CheA [Spirochaetales bacterium]|uniref:Chemotaxis protein CheA n=1 Tax=Candidatus Thalassospirochaeta sargassi TaxID=3119039 RepID=A0AAJ1MHV7_9SPIO|nr:chemotaxis protein CheA [Spirochaetales bacterium]
MSDYLDPNNEELLKDFFMEAELQVETFEQNILVLENEPHNKEAVDEIFRAAHTLKGAAGTVQMDELSHFTHLCEDALDEIRAGNVQVNPEIVDTILEAIDVIKAMLEARIEGDIYQEDISAISAKLEALLKKEAPAEAVKAEKKSEPAKPTPAESTEGGITEYELLEMKEQCGENEKIVHAHIVFNEDNPMNTVGGVQVYAALKKNGTVLGSVPDFDELYKDIFHPEADFYIATEASPEEIAKTVNIPDVITDMDISYLEEDSAGEADATTEAEPAEESPAPEKAAEEVESAALPVPLEDGKEGKKQPEKEIRKSNKGSGSILRVDSRRIDNLLNLVSETVITKASFNQISNSFSENLLEFQTNQNIYRDKMKELFDKLPDYLESIQNGMEIKDIKNEINERYGSLFNVFDELESDLKATVAKFQNTSQSLARTTSELQEGVMQIRMVPISQIFSRFPRLVRDLSRSCGKDIKLIIEGEDTELDKSVIDDLLDPLIHCVRNSVDHGIESPEARLEAGKPSNGTVLLKARNEGNMIVIEVSDDGNGIDVEKVKAKAIANGVIHPSKNLTDVEAYNLIFEPGFSTAKEITNISGRGVGLDVVRKQIEKLNGNVSVYSEPGAGSVFTIKLPLTLAIIQGLLVRVGTEIYAIPITSVVDSHRIKPEEIKMIDNYEVFNVRQDVVSLIRLNRLFRIPTEETGEYHFIVIVGSGDKKMGLMVDSLIGEEDVVIKPLKDKYTNSPGIAGATILGDGTVSLIIDVSQLLELGLKREIEERQLREATIS